MNKKDRILVENYAYAMRFVHFVIGLLPPFLRRPIWKLLLKELGSNVMIGEKCYFHYPWKIKIGNDVDMGNGCQIYPSYQFKDVFVEIGNGVLIAPNLTIFGAGHPVDSPIDEHIAASVRIGDGVYVGGNVSIRYGVTVGTGAVIAAGSVVVKDVANGSIVGGNPAKEIRIRQTD